MQDDHLPLRKSHHLRRHLVHPECLLVLIHGGEALALNASHVQHICVRQHTLQICVTLLNNSNYLKKKSTDFNIFIYLFNPGCSNKFFDVVRHGKIGRSHVAKCHTVQSQQPEAQNILSILSF